MAVEESERELQNLDAVYHSALFRADENENSLFALSEGDKG